MDGSDELEEGTWKSLVTYNTLTFLNWNTDQPEVDMSQNCRQMSALLLGFSDVACNTTSGLTSAKAFCELDGKS